MRTNGVTINLKQPPVAVLAPAPRGRGRSARVATTVSVEWASDRGGGTGAAVVDNNEPSVSTTPPDVLAICHPNRS